MNKTINAGKYKHKIQIYNAVVTTDSDGFQTTTLSQTPVLSPKAEVKTTKGMTLIKNDTDFEKAYTRFTIRYPKHTTITRDTL